MPLSTRQPIVAARPVAALGGRLALAAAFAVLLAPGALVRAPGRARADEPPPARAPAGEVTYLRPGAELSWRAINVPLRSEQLGAIAAGELDRVKARSAGAPVPEQPPLYGTVPADAPGPGWATRALAGASRGHAPLGARELDGHCRCATQVGDERVERIAALYAQAVFRAGDEASRVRMLELRLHYSDGAVVYLNGREVARRKIGRDAAPLQPVSRPTGPEWESFYIPAAGLLRPGDNRLAVEVVPWAGERGPSLDLALVGRMGPRIVRGPLIMWRGATSATIAFDTDLPARGEVRYAIAPATTPTTVATGSAASGAAPGNGASSAALDHVMRSAGGTLAVHHRVSLTGLPAGGAVRYRVLAGGDVSPLYTFHPQPQAGAPIRFAVYGDMRGGHQVHAQIVQSILDEAPDFALVTGDMVIRGVDEGAWQRFFDVIEPLASRVPYYPVEGNHDVGQTGDEDRRMSELFPLPPAPPDRPPWGSWYSFDVADLHIVVLDSNTYDRPEQLSWLAADLAQARRAGARAIFAAVHDGPYSRGVHGGNPIARERYVPLLSRYRVAMLFAGHDHLYQRGQVNGLRYIVSGGGGAPLYPVTCGVPHRPRCRVADGARFAASANHYVLVTVQGDAVEVCARRPDRTPLEPCVHFALP